MSGPAKAMAFIVNRREGAGQQGGGGSISLNIFPCSSPLRDWIPLTQELKAGGRELGGRGWQAGKSRS